MVTRRAAQASRRASRATSRPILLRILPVAVNINLHIGTSSRSKSESPREVLLKLGQRLLHPIVGVALQAEHQRQRIDQPSTRHQGRAVVPQL